MTVRLIRRWAACFAAGLFAAAPAFPAATPVFSDTAVISTGAPPYTLTFTAPATETVDVTVQDLAKLPSPPPGVTALTSLALAVTSAGAIVPASAGGSAGQATLAASGTVSIAATAGTVYAVRVIGVPASGAGSDNAVSVAVTSHASGKPYVTGSNSFRVPTAASPQPVYANVLSVSLPDTGDYQVTLVDDQAPVALGAGGLLGFLLSSAPGATAIPLLTGTNTVPGLAAGTYKLTLVAIADSTAKAGMFGIRIVSPKGTSVIDQTIPVGAWVRANNGADLTVTASAAVTLSVADLQGPASLAALGAAATVGATFLGQATPSTAAVFTAPSTGTVSLWQLATPASGSAGAYTLRLAPIAGGSEFKATQAATDPTSNLFVYVATIATGGSFTPSLTDLQFPSNLSMLDLRIYQAGALIASSPAQASIPAVTLAAGDTVLVAHAVPPSGGDGVFSLGLTPGSGSTPVFTTIQPVGPNLHSVPFTLATAGYFDVALTDLGWPAAFKSWNGLITKATAVQPTGLPLTINGSATFPNAQLGAGDYIITLNAVPAAGQIAGLYALAVTPSAPVAQISASPTSVATGAGTRLTWTATASTSCTAATSGGVSGATRFTGTQSASGSLDDGPFTTTGTVVYTLTCSGDGGSTSATASVTVTQGSTSGGGGGGGRFGLGALGCLATLALVKRRRLTVARRPV
jgi:hypothetical protein